MELPQEHTRKGKWRKVKKTASRKDKRSPRLDPIPEPLEPLELLEANHVQEITHNPTPSHAKLFAACGYEGLEDAQRQCDICTTCPSCKAQQQENKLWKAANAAEVEKARDLYNEAKEREQERREHYDWCYRNKHY